MAELNPMKPNNAQPFNKSRGWRFLQSLLAYWSVFRWYCGPLYWIPLLIIGLLAIVFQVNRNFDQQEQVATKQIREIEEKTSQLLSARAQQARQRTAISATSVSASPRWTPAFDSINQVSPLERYLRDSQTRGMQIRQVEYQWPRGNETLPNVTDATTAKRGNRSNLRKLEVTLQVEGDYAAIRRWVGTVLLDSPNMQLSVFQMQRQTTLEANITAVTGVITLAVYYEAKT